MRGNKGAVGLRIRLLFHRTESTRRVSRSGVETSLLERFRAFLLINKKRDATRSLNAPETMH